ncbi:ATP-dependent DNA helicase RecG [Clostridia bacterium]|nr:ATP-dependent DNA helicase RecG [Clostridia bacterium]
MLSVFYMKEKTAEKTDITSLPGISEKRAALYGKLKVRSVYDLLTYFPRDYIDYSAPVPLSNVTPGEYAVIKATVLRKLPPYFGRVSVFKAVLLDESGTEEIVCTFFNSEYSLSRLLIGKEYVFYGKITVNGFVKEISSPTYIESGNEALLTPKYRLTAGLSLGIVTANIRAALLFAEKNNLFTDPLTREIRERFSFTEKEEALRQIHFPVTRESMLCARRRLAFEELLILQLGLSMVKSRNLASPGAVMTERELSPFFKSLPFTPTAAQERAISECIHDMCSGKSSMNRLLQGDVGSGKTLVAAAICYFAALNGYQSCIMAPTEILARQHFETLEKFLLPLGISVSFLSGSLPVKEKNAAKARISSGETKVIAGTQSLIQNGIVFSNLGLTVTDEQHRFGVNQRSTIAEKGVNPHTLVMSATPIPRTLGLIIYGDLDISLLDEMPKGRVPIKTYNVNSSYRERLYRFILKYVDEGKQAYIVCPLIEAGTDGTSEKSAATQYFHMLESSYFTNVHIGLLHGKMKPAEKDAVMNSFKSGEISVLVSTTVIEVGIDVPNAVVMVIENAEQFGLSALHQLRGRIGRGSVESHCILVTDSKSPYTLSRIDTMVKTSDGFEIAAEDLKLRGPGDFFGEAQHGLPPLKIADMAQDITIVEETKLLKEEILARDPELGLAENAGLRTAVFELCKSILI